MDSKNGGITRSYYDSLWSADQGQVAVMKENVSHLAKIHSDSLEIYRCFLKNFQNPTGASYQQALSKAIQDWYGRQSELVAKALIEAYRRQKGELNPFFVSKLNKFETEAPVEVKLMISDFYKNDIINNPDFINTEKSSKLGARVDALIGLKYLGVLNEDENRAERELFERALSAGIIKKIDEDSFFSFSRRLLP